VVGQATSTSALGEGPAGFGLATTDHAAPSQLSTKVRPGFAAVEYVPTAKQLDAALHAIDLISTPVAPTGAGNDVSAQLVPFQRSTNAPAIPGSDPAVASFPVAKHRVGLGHATPVSQARVVELGTGTEMSTQVWPFQRSTSGLSGPEPNPPTAKQFVVPEQLRSTTAPSANPCGIWIGARRRTLPSQRSAYSARAGPPKLAGRP
jgi:hypothetical protein